MRISSFRKLSALAPLFLALGLCVIRSTSALAQAQLGWVSTLEANSSVNLRKNPATNASIQASVKTGQKLELLNSQPQRAVGLSGGWYQVRVPQAPQEAAWIRGDFLSFAAPIRPQGSQSCDDAIAQAEQRLKSVPKTQLIQRTKVAHRYTDGPSNRPDAINFSFKEQGATHVLSSPVFMNQMAASLIENCPFVSLVSFGVISQGDAVIFTYGLMPGQLVRAFGCKSGPDSHVGPAPWGQQPCS